MGWSLFMNWYSWSLWRNLSVLNLFSLKTEGSFPCRGSFYPSVGVCGVCASCGDGMCSKGGEGGLTEGVGILHGTDAAVLGWVGVGGIQVGVWLMDWRSAWVNVGNIVMTTSMGGLVSVSSGVVGLVFTSFCSYGEMGVLLSVQITTESEDRLGEIAWNMFCLRSSFQYHPSSPSIEVPSLYTEVASSSQTVSWLKGEHRARVMSGKGLGLGWWCLHYVYTC